MRAKLLTTFSIIIISVFFMGFQVFAAENSESEGNDEENITNMDSSQDVCSNINDLDDSQIGNENDEAIDEDQCSEKNLTSADEEKDDDGDSDKESNMICHKDEDTKNPATKTKSDLDEEDSDKNDDQSESDQNEDGNQDAHHEEESLEDSSAVNEDQEDCNTDEDKESSQEENPSEDSSETENDSGTEEDIDNDQPESDNEADDDSDEQQEDSSGETDLEETDEEDDQQAVDESIESEDDNEDKVTEDNQSDNDEDVAENDKGKDDSKSDKKDTQKAKKENTIKEAKAKSGPPYKLGDRDNAIKDIKKKLNKIGFDGISETNYYGDWTQTRVKQFQENYGLKANGVVNTKTLNKLDEVYNSSYQFGKRNSNVTAFKKKLNRTKFGGITVTNYYGNFTKQRVEEFQRFVGMTPNGIADSQTRSELDTFLSGYQKGDRSKTVVDIKKKLNKIGFGGITVTEYYGDWTQTRVKQFQENYGLKVNGIANAKTLNKLDEVYNSSYQFGKRNSNVTAFKKKLNKTKFGGITVTNYYGNFTKQRVEEFQRFVGMTPNGIADSQTRSELDTFLSGYQKGDRSKAIVNIKKKLNSIGFDSITETNYYGDWTQTRVKQFQENYGLKVNGVANTKTLNKLDEVYNSPYQFGKRNSNVTAFKKKLNKTKFGGITVTNYYGNFTKQRVEEFQRFVGMTPNGIADSQTRSELDTFLSGYQKGDRSKAIINLKKKLNSIGFDSITETNYYGDWTQTRVKQFQENYGLKVNGIANAKTLNKLDEVYNSPYKFGERSKNVTSFKKKLNKTQFGGITVTNYYGSFTKQRVEEFQRFIGVKQNGIADSKTRLELDKYLSGYKKGDRSKAIADFKKKLNKIGFGGITVTNYYGDWTQTRVKQFQKYYSLKADGAVGPSTMNKINAVYNSPFQKGKSHKETAEIKKKLNDIGYSGITVTNYYGDYTKKQVKKFQRDYGLRVNGIADEVTRKKLDKVWDASDSVKETSYGLTLKQALNLQMKVNPQSDKNYAYVSKEYIKNGRVTASALNVRKGPSAAYNAIGQLLEGAKVSVQSEVNGWYAISYSYSGWVSATPEDTEYYLNPNNFKNDDKQKFQFLDLSVTSGATKSVLNDYLTGKGTLAKQGQAFIDAGNKHGVNDVYLISHAIHETGNGSSTLASGIPVDKNGKITRNSNGKIAKTKKTVATVYNMYGIGAVDSCPIECGAKRAFDEGWTTPYKAIVGGASFIGKGYIDKGQNTLYKMRWNPAQMDKGNVTHQYATDVGWASKQVTTLYNLYQKLSFYKLSLDIPKYK